MVAGEDILGYLGCLVAKADVHRGLVKQKARRGRHSQLEADWLTPARLAMIVPGH